MSGRYDVLGYNVALALVIAFLGVLACNTSALVGSPGVSTPSPHPSVTTLPTPTSSPTIPAPTATDCGNADYQAFDPADPDDPPGQADAFWCYWLCAVDTGTPPAAHSTGYLGDPNPPHEVLKEYDYDPPSAAYQFGPTIYLPCYSARP